MRTTEGQAGKRPVNLTLNAANVEQVRRLTGNVSATVDDLLTTFIARETAAQTAKQDVRDEVCAALNSFNAVYGSFADDHSTL